MDRWSAGADRQSVRTASRHTRPDGSVPPESLAAVEAEAANDEGMLMAWATLAI